MAFMRRDVNLGLLLLIAAALLMFSGFTVYYQTTFKNLSTTYKNQLNELDKVTKDLEAKRGLLNQTSTQLQLNTQKQQDLSKQFVDIKGERDQLVDDKNKLTADLTSTKATLAQTQASLTQTQSNLEAEKTSHAADVASLNAKIASLNSRIDSLNSKIDCLKSKADADEGTC